MIMKNTKKKNPWAQVLSFLLPMVFWSFHCSFCFFYYFLYLLKYQFFFLDDLIKKIMVKI